MCSRTRTLSTQMVLLFALLALTAGRQAAYAHKLKLFATAEGNTIAGRVYFSRGQSARNVKVQVFGPQGRKLGETSTNDTGRFIFQAQFLCDHTFTAQTGDGHAASYTVKAEELPESLNPPGDVSAAAGGSESTEVAPLADVRAADEVKAARLQQMVERAVARQVRPLREELDAHWEKVRLRDILGGIGYILGLAGIASYFLSRARSRKDEERSRSNVRPSGPEAG